MTKDNNVDLINTHKAAELLGVKVGTLYSLVFRKEIPFYRISKRIIRFKESEIRAYIHSCQERGVKCIQVLTSLMKLKA